MDTLLFHETQSLGLALVAVFLVELLLLAFLFRTPFPGSKKAGGLLRSVLATVFLFAFLLAATTRLETSIYPDRIEFGFNSAFYHGKPEVVAPDTIRSLQVVSRTELSWGIREDGPNEICYSARGTNVLELMLKSGRVIKIGTCKPDVLQKLFLAGNSLALRNPGS